MLRRILRTVGYTIAGTSYVALLVVAFLYELIP